MRGEGTVPWGRGLKSYPGAVTSLLELLPKKSQGTLEKATIWRGLGLYISLSSVPAAKSLTPETPIQVGISFTPKASNFSGITSPAEPQIPHLWTGGKKSYHWPWWKHSEEKLKLCFILNRSWDSEIMCAKNLAKFPLLCSLSAPQALPSPQTLCLQNVTLLYLGFQEGSDNPTRAGEACLCVNSSKAGREGFLDVHAAMSKPTVKSEDMPGS